MFTFFKICIGVAAFLLLATSVAFSVVTHIEGSVFFLVVGLLFVMAYACYTPSGGSDDV